MSQLRRTVVRTVTAAALMVGLLGGLLNGRTGPGAHPASDAAPFMGHFGVPSAQAAQVKPTYDYPVVDSAELEKMTKGQPVYLKLWATWCQPCMKEMPALERAHEQYKDKIKVLAINIGLNETNASIKQVIAQYGLKLPVLIDKGSDITHRLGALGTPFHVLIDKSGHVVFKGHEANAELESALSRLARNDGSLTPQPNAAEAGRPAPAIPVQQGKTTAVLFFAPWCDWYLEKHRPQDAQRCVQAQNWVNTWQKELKGVQFVGVSSGLWADDKDLANYKKKFNVAFPVVSDANNDLFPQYKISKFPTLVVIRDGKELYREDAFQNAEAIATQLRRY